MIDAGAARWRKLVHPGHPAALQRNIALDDTAVVLGQIEGIRPGRKAYGSSVHIEKTQAVILNENLSRIDFDIVDGEPPLIGICVILCQDEILQRPVFQL
jgi:hypothetical protein